jgi:hypothetical protein
MYEYAEKHNYAFRYEKDHMAPLNWALSMERIGHGFDSPESSYGNDTCYNHPRGLRALSQPEQRVLAEIDPATDKVVARINLPGTKGNHACT